MKVQEKENKVPKLNKSFNQRSPFSKAACELSITPMLIKELTGKADLSTITVLNLRFKDDRLPKIKRITGLDFLINLRRLDMSFNLIEKIENLSLLHSLIDLNLNQNSIEMLENLVLFHYNY